MEKSRIRTILERIWPGLPGEKGLVATICELSAPADILEEELVSKAMKMGFSFKPSTPSDDDVYWLEQSPFDGKWYTFASLFCSGGFPISPVYIDDEYPNRFDE